MNALFQKEEGKKKEGWMLKTETCGDEGARRKLQTDGELNKWSIFKTINYVLEGRKE